MDYKEGGDLRYYLTQGINFNEEQISIISINPEFIMRCLVAGLTELHRNNIIHRDIKPENIIIDKKGYAYITDLGIARLRKP